MTERDDLDAELAGLRAPAPPPMSPALEAELANLAPIATRRPWRQLAIVLAIALAYAGGMLAVLTIRRDLDELPMGWLMMAGIAWLTGFVVPMAIALIPRRGSLTPRWRAAAVASVVVSIGFVVIGWFVHPMGPSSESYGTEHFMRGHTCLEIGLATALAPSVIGAIFLRGALPVGSRWTAAALGAGGGCLGGLVLHLHCHVADKLHVAIIHGGVVIVAAALAAGLLPRVTDGPLR